MYVEPRRGRIIALVALVVAALALTAPAQAAPESTQVRQAPSSMVLPAWAASAPVTGARQVWVLPVYDTGERRWDHRRLLSAINDDLGWFARISGKRFSMRATRVLDPLAFDSARGSACNAVTRVLAPAISRFYAEAPAGTHLVALTRASDCPYSAIGETPGRSVMLTGYDLDSTASRRTLLHELGHNLGLPHASSYAGGVLSTTRSTRTVSRTVVEYGDTADIMGGHGAAPRLSAAALATLGWGDGVQHVPSTAAGTHRVDLAEISRSGADAVVVVDPVSGARYSLTYVDAPSRLGAGMPVAGRGVYLHKVSDAGRGSLGYWIPWEGHRSGASMGIGAGPGTAWLSPTRAIAMRVVSLGRSARLEIRIDPRGRLTDSVGPAWPLPPSVTVKRGVARLTLPAAWDQSGVTRYRITARGGTVRDITQPRDLTRPGSARITLDRSRAVIQVVAIDSAGNTTTWSQRVRR